MGQAVVHRRFWSASMLLRNRFGWGPAITTSFSMTSGCHIATRHTMAPPQSARSAPDGLCYTDSTAGNASEDEAQAMH